MCSRLIACIEIRSGVTVVSHNAIDHFELCINMQHYEISLSLSLSLIHISYLCLCITIRTEKTYQEGVWFQEERKRQ